MTRKLYYEDLYMKEFEASVLEIREKNGAYHVALDYTPCCGTHNKSTGEVGVIHITRTEQTKSGTRIYFNCGRTALLYLIQIYGYWKAVTAELSCEDTKVAESIRKMKADMEKETASRQHQLARFVKMEAEQLRGKVFWHSASDGGWGCIKEKDRCAPVI